MLLFWVLWSASARLGVSSGDLPAILGAKTVFSSDVSKLGAAINDDSSSGFPGECGEDDDKASAIPSRRPITIGYN